MLSRMPKFIVPGWLKFIETVYADLKKPRKGPPAKSGLNFSDGGQ